MAETLNALIGTITATMRKGDTVQLIGLGVFSTGTRAARVGRNPATGAGFRSLQRRPSNSRQARGSRM